MADQMACKLSPDKEIAWNWKSKLSEAKIREEKIVRRPKEPRSALRDRNECGAMRGRFSGLVSIQTSNGVRVAIVAGLFA